MHVPFIQDNISNKRNYLSYSIVGYHQIISDIIKSLNLNPSLKVNLTQARNGNESSKKLIKDFISNYLNNLKDVSAPYNAEEILQISTELLSEIIGYGPLDELYKTIKKQDIFVNNYFNIHYQDGENRHVTTDIRFRDEEHFDNLINRLLDSVNESLTPINPSIQVALVDGTRLTALHKDISGRTSAVFRFHDKNIFTFDRQLQYEVMDEKIVRILKSFVDMKANALIYGPTGSGKTSLIGTLEHYTYQLNRRFVSISKTNEHFFLDEFPDANCVEMCPKEKGKVSFTLADCLKTALGYRMEYIYFNELLDHSIFTLLDALSTGHSGASGLHAEDIHKVITRTISLMKEYNNTFTDEFCASKIDAAIDVFIQMESKDKTKKLQCIHMLDSFNGTTPVTIPLINYEEKSNTWHINKQLTPKLKARILKYYKTEDDYFSYIMTGNR